MTLTDHDKQPGHPLFAGLGSVRHRGGGSVGVVGAELKFRLRLVFLGSREKNPRIEEPGTPFKRRCCVVPHGSLSRPAARHGRHRRRCPAAPVRPQALPSRTCKDLSVSRLRRVSHGLFQERASRSPHQVPPFLFCYVACLMLICGV